MRTNQEPPYLVPTLFFVFMALTTFVWVTGWPLASVPYAPGIFGTYERIITGGTFLAMMCLGASIGAMLLKRARLAYACLVLWGITLVVRFAVLRMMSGG